jgi:hypothetical protein
MEHSRRFHVKHWSMKILLWFALCLVLVGCGASGPTHIRVRNGTDQDFTSVVVGTNSFGDIASGSVSRYQLFPKAFRYEYVRLFAGTNQMIIQPTDFVGEKPLGRGRFTYVLRIDSNTNLTIQCEHDK